MAQELKATGTTGTVLPFWPNAARSVTTSTASSVTANAECSATKAQGQRRQSVAEHQPDLVVFVDDAELAELLQAGRVAVHRHGSKRNYADYRGEYLLLRQKGGRGEKRRVLASGRPEKLRAHLAGLGVALCVAHRALNVCPQCGRQGGNTKHDQKGESV